MVFPLIDSLGKEDKVKVETLKEPRRIKEQYKLTPATLVTVTYYLKQTYKKLYGSIAVL